MLSENLFSTKTPLGSLPLGQHGREKKQNQKNTKFGNNIKIYILCLVFLVGIAFARVIIASQNQKTFVEGEKVSLEGTLQQEPVLQKRFSTFYLGRTKVITSSSEIHYGDKVLVQGEFSRGELFLPKVVRVGTAPVFLKWLDGFRQQSMENLNALLPEKEAALLGGVLLGVKSGLSQSFTQQLKTTGTIHVAVVSGYNITLVAAFFLLLSPLITRRWAIVCSLLAIAIYSTLTGLGAATLRAALMASVAFLGTLSGRVVYPLYSLFMVGLILVLINPLIVSDLSFQLSFLATLGILVFSSSSEKFFKFMPSFLREDFSVSVSAQLLTLPVILYAFGTLSLVSPLVNGLTLWVIPFVTIGGFVVLCTSFIYLPFAGLGATILAPSLKYFVLMVDFFSKLPFASVRFAQEDWLLLLGYYLLLISFLIFRIEKKRGLKNSGGEAFVSEKKLVN